MKKIKYYLAISLLITPFIASADGGIPDSTQPLSSSNTMTFSGAADAQQYQSIIFNSGSNSLQLCNSTKDGLKYDLTAIRMVPRVTYSNLTFQSGPSTSRVYLFDSSIPAYKITPWYASDDFNGQDMGATKDKVQRSIYYAPTIVWTGYKSDDDRHMQDNKPSSGGVRVDHGFYIYKSADRIPAGTSYLKPVPSAPFLMDYECLENGIVKEIIHITMNTIKVINEVRSCVPDKKTETVQMGPISLTDLEAAKTSGSTAGAVNQSFSLSCDPNVQVWFSLVDLKDQTNVSYISKLTADSTAKGVGYSVNYGSKPLRFGPDISSAFPAGDTTVDRVLIKTTDNNGSKIPVLYSLNFSYAPTGEAISKGTATSLIGITYSYQ